MRRFNALLLAAGLAAAPAGAAPCVTIGHVPWLEPFYVSIAQARLGLQIGSEKDCSITVTRVDPLSPAAAAGLKAGDVITEVHGHPIASAHDLLLALDRAQQPVALAVVRDGKRVEVKLGSQAWTAASWLHELLKPFERSRTSGA